MGVLMGPHPDQGREDIRLFRGKRESGVSELLSNRKKYARTLTNAKAKASVRVTLQVAGFRPDSKEESQHTTYASHPRKKASSTIAGAVARQAEPAVLPAEVPQVAVLGPA